MQLYAGSDGTFYTETEVGLQIETDAWQAHMWDQEEGWLVVEPEDTEPLWLVPIDEADLPAGIEVQTSDDGPTIVDRRDA